jgi:hypothetical protein
MLSVGDGRKITSHLSALRWQYNSKREESIMKTARITINAMVFIFTIFFALISAQADDFKSSDHHNRRIKFDVAENGTRFVFDEAPVHEGTTPPMPAYGNPFITQGYIYKDLAGVGGDAMVDDESGSAVVDRVCR